MRKATIVICYVLLALPLFGQGIIIDSAAIARFKQLSVRARGPIPENIPPNWSLKKYCPTPKEQELDRGTCAAWSTVYTAQTILLAIQYDWTTQAEIDQHAFDPMYVFNSLKKSNDNNCSAGIHVHTILDHLKKLGSIKAKNLGQQSFKCLSSDDYLINTPHIKVSHYDCPVNYNTLEENQEKLTLESLKAVKAAISQNQPVVALIRPSDRGKWPEAANNKTFWQLKNPNYKPLNEADMWKYQYPSHALAIIAYDDDMIGYNGQRGAFQIMNSWGKAWQDNGFAWITYEDFADWFFFAYAFHMNSKVSLYKNFSGGRSSNMSTSYQDTIYHITKPGVSYDRFTLTDIINLSKNMYVLITDTTKKIVPITHVDGNNNPIFSLDNTIGTEKIIILHTAKDIDKTVFAESLEDNYKTMPLLKAVKTTVQHFGGNLVYNTGSQHQKEKDNIVIPVAIEPSTWVMTLLYLNHIPKK